MALGLSSAVAMISPFRSCNCSTGVPPLVWTAARAPSMPGMLRVHLPVSHVSVPVAASQAHAMASLAPS